MNDSERPFDADRLPPGATPPAATDPDRVGPYRVVGRLGAGGMGAVYAGLAPDGSCAAVKAVHEQFAADPDFRARFAREVAMVARVRSVCAPAFLAADAGADVPWLATEYVPGDTLRAHIRKHGPLSGGMLDALAAGLAEALAAIHAAGVVHRDLKPGNVILAPTGPKVLDFGIARAVGGTALTRTGGLFGTPGWVSPEQYGGAEATDRSDVFAWAGMVLFAATGREPFGTGPVSVVSHRTRTEEPDLAGVPDHLAPLLRRAFSKDPEGRPTALQALDELTAGWSATRIQPAGAPAAGAPATAILPEMLRREWTGVAAPRPRRVRRPRRGLFLAAGAAVLAAVLVGGFLAARSPGGDTPPEDPSTASSAGPAADGPSAAAQGPAVERDPQDGEAVVAEAVELARGASSFIVHNSDATGELMSQGRNEQILYTEDPEPRYRETAYLGPATEHVLEVGDGPDVLMRLDSNLAGVVEGSYYRPDPADLPEPRGRWNRSLGLLEQLTGGAAAFSYQGVTDTPFETYPEELTEGLDMAGRTGHHYTGTLRLEDERYTYEGDFDLWVGEDGYPQHFQSFLRFAEVEEDYITESVGFIAFDTPVEIEVPDESEIAADQDAARPSS
ncbi:serine/threonine-protein kinase [Nocardiopsis flavescens]